MKIFPSIKKTIVSSAGAPAISWAVQDQNALPRTNVQSQADSFNTVTKNDLPISGQISNLDISHAANPAIVQTSVDNLSTIHDAGQTVIVPNMDRLGVITSGSILTAISVEVTYSFVATSSLTIPAAITTLKGVECWAGGGRGEAALITGGGGGGGGGYAKKNNMAVVSGSVHTVHVGTSDDDSWFSTVGTVFAQRGQPGSAGSGTGQGAGGPGGGMTSIGDVKFSGGAGGGGGGILANGGGGGGGAGDAAVGSPGNSGGPAGAGGNARGGSGGIGGALLTPGNAGFTNGGGGGGASTLAAAGAGARGEIRITVSL